MKTPCFTELDSMIIYRGRNCLRNIFFIHRDISNQNLKYVQIAWFCAVFVGVRFSSVYCKSVDFSLLLYEFNFLLRKTAKECQCALLPPDR